MHNDSRNIPRKFCKSKKREIICNSVQNQFVESELVLHAVRKALSLTDYWNMEYARDRKSQWKAKNIKYG